MPLVDIKRLNKIFDDYELSLKKQQNSKKTATKAFNTVRNFFFPSDNEYRNDLEGTKIDKIATFRKQYLTTQEKSETDEINSWMEHLKILHEELMNVKDAEYDLFGYKLSNESKYGFALRLISNFIYQQIKHHPLYTAFVESQREKYDVYEKQVQLAKTKGNKPQDDVVKMRNAYIINLVKMGDLGGTVIASQYGLLNGFQKPDKYRFSSSEIDNPLISKEVEIHPDVPWAFQSHFIQLFDYRIEKHTFPLCKEDWNDWKIQQNLLKKIADNDPGKTDPAQQGATTQSPPLQPNTTPANSTAQITAQLPVVPTTTPVIATVIQDAIVTPVNTQQPMIVVSEPEAVNKVEPIVETQRLSRSQQKKLAKKAQQEERYESESSSPVSGLRSF